MAERKRLFFREDNLKRFSILFMLLISLTAFTGCVKSPTAPGSGGWVRVTGHAPFAGRYGLTGTVFNNSMWIIGGAASDASASVTYWYGDVWSSGNGSSWTQATSGASFGGRYGSEVLTYNGKMWLIGGNQSNALKNDVWNSSDGVNWTQVLANGPAGPTQFSTREDFGAVVFNNLMWVIGGAPGPLNDVWSSPDGITWTNVLANGPANVNHFDPRWGFAITVHNNRIWILGGAKETPRPTNAFSDVWSSPDGINWTRVSNLNSFGTTYYHEAVTNNGEIWLTGGVNLPWGPRNTILDTPDGINWNYVTSSPYPPRFFHQSLSFNNKVWIIGGMDNILTRTYYNDVWHGP